MHRREMLQNMAISAVAAIMPMTAESAPSLEDDCQFHANALAEALMKKHGSVYKVKIDCLNEFVLVHREASPS